ncbi:MAG: aquaporin [Polyangiaceae bacterium]
MSDNLRRYIAEGAGTFGVVFAGCGAASLAGNRIGDTGVALAFGLALTAMTTALGPLSGGHFNPAVTLALASIRRVEWRRVPAYVGAQLAGAALAASLLFPLAASAGADPSLAAKTLANGYNALSPRGFGLAAAAVVETVLTALFVLVFLTVAEPSQERVSVEAARAQRSTHFTAAAVIGVGYGLIHLVGLPVTRMGANPARSFGPSLYAGLDALVELPLFFIAPIAGAVLAAQLYRVLWRPRPREDIAGVSAPPSMPAPESSLEPARRFSLSTEPPDLDDDADETSGPRTLRSPRPPNVSLTPF